MRHAFRTVVAESGWRGLMRGWAPNMQRAALVNLGGKVLSGVADLCLSPSKIAIKELRKTYTTVRNFVRHILLRDHPLIT